MSRSLAYKIEAANTVLLANGNLDAIGEFFAPDYVAHGTDQEMAGHGAIRRFLAMLRRAFPDLQVEVEILVKARDRVAPGKERSGPPTRATSRASLARVVPSCGATW